jgi:hypothetical protein
MRSKLNLLSGLVGICLAAGVAFADNAPQPGATDQPAATPAAPASDQSAANTTTTASKDEEVICKKVDAPTGSRAGAKKVCRTAAEWRKLQEGARETVDAVQSSGRADNPPGN